MRMRMPFRRHGRGRELPPMKDISIPLPAELSTDFRLLEGKETHFFRRGGALEVESGSRRFSGVRIIRLFPLTEPEGWLSVMEETGTEIGIVRDPSDLDPESRRIVAEEIRRNYLVPRIEKIVALRPEGQNLEWDVSTDRGRVSFTTPSSSEYVQRLGDDRVLFADIAGRRFEIRSLRALDGRSRALLRREFL